MKNASRPLCVVGDGVITPHMADLLVVVTILAFFALCVAFVYGCDRIIGSDEDADIVDSSAPSESDDTAVRGDAVNGENIAALVLAVLLAVYLVAALLFPERF